MQVVAGWYRDPDGRYDYRWWDGSTWTEHVARDGQTATAPALDGAPPPPPPTADEPLEPAGSQAAGAAWTASSFIRPGAADAAVGTSDSVTISHNAPTGSSRPSGSSREQLALFGHQISPVRVLVIVLAFLAVVMAIAVASDDGAELRQEADEIRVEMWGDS